MNLTLSFPPLPIAADKKIIKPSASFNKNVYRCIGAVALFVVTYVVLLLMVIALAIAFCIFGIAVMSAKIGFITLALGLALIGSGLLLVYFVIKFIFRRNKKDLSGMIELSEHDQPKLFAFIRQLTTEANAPFPKRIFISADVNAAVFYNSSFWSMFLPVKKNLKIGLGLVNALNVSEFKAVMAHEFGHFSQRSMKFGSYVYNMNRVIYNMLYDNDGYTKLLNAMSKLHSLFYLTAYINLKIITLIQYVLKKVYIVLNKTYMALSREMEFHADAMAAFVSGSNHVINSLKRIDVAQTCYNELLNFWSAELSKDKRSDNFYPQHLEMIRYYAQKNNLQQDATGLPVIAEWADVANVRRVIIEDQWSSHPSTEDREAHLRKIDLVSPTVEGSAWALFNNAEQLQVLLTDDVYSTTTASSKTSRVGTDDFKKDFYADVNEFELDKIYAGYYDGRYINLFDVDEAAANAGTTDVGISDVLSGTNTSLPVVASRLQQDIYTLESIAESKDIKTFDYKGRKYKSKEAGLVIKEIEQEQQATTEQIKKLDRDIFTYFYTKANVGQREQLVAKYKKMFALQSDSTTDFDLYGSVMDYFNNVYNTMPYEKITQNLAEVYEKEKLLKPRIKDKLTDENTKAYFTSEQLKAVEYYVNTNLVYFHKPDYDNDAINSFNDGTGAFISAIVKRNFEAKKDLLSFQAEMLNGI